MENRDIDMDAELTQDQVVALCRAEMTRLEAAYGREVLNHKETKALLNERETRLKTIQRIAEAGGQ